MLVRFLLTLATIASLTTVARGAPAIYLTWSQIPTTTISSEIQSFITGGYATVGDQGAGCFYRRGASSDPGAVQSADGAWWGFDSTQIMQARCFGVFGSGDLTSKIQAMVGSVGLFGVVQFDTQTYDVSAQVDIGAQTWRGNGRLATIFNYTGNSCFLKLPHNWATVENLLVRGPGSKAAGTACGIQLGDAEIGGAPRGQTLRNIGTENFPTYGVDVVGSTNFVIDNSEIMNSGLVGIRVRNVYHPDNGDSTIQATRIINGNEACQNNESQPLAVGNAGIQAITGAGLRIVGNKIYGFFNGIEYAQEDAKTSSVSVISANSIEGQCLANIHLGMQGPHATGHFGGLTITGNEMLLNPYAGVDDIQNMLVDSNGIDTLAISGNLFRGATVAAPPRQHGLIVTGGTSISVTGNVFNWLYSGVEIVASSASDSITVGPNRYDHVDYRLIDSRPISSSKVDTSDVATVLLTSSSEYTSYWKIGLPQDRAARLHVTVSATAVGAGMVYRDVEVAISATGTVVTATPIRDEGFGPPIDLVFDTGTGGHVIVKLKRNSADGATALQGNLSLAQISGNVYSLEKM